MIKVLFFNAGSFNGSLSNLKAHELGSIVFKHILDYTKSIPDEVIIGQALTAAQGNYSLSFYLKSYL